MTTIGTELIAASRMRVGKSFLHHFKPTDECQGGEVTIANCMERGMDDSGYDCSGLIIAGLCDVLGIEKGDWSWELRHVRQMTALAADVDVEQGDLLLFESLSPSGNQQRTHIGIHVSPGVAIHSDGMSKFVSEGFVEGDITEVRAIPLGSILELVDAPEPKVGQQD